MSNQPVAFELTSDHELATYGGTTSLRDGLSLNIGSALQEGADEEAAPNGIIVTDDPLLIDSLDGRWDVVRAPVPPGALVTSHQLADTLRPQHQRDKTGVPAIASQSAGMSDAERVAAQAAGAIPLDAPVPAEQPTDAGENPGEQPGHPDAEAAAAAAAQKPPETATVTTPGAASSAPATASPRSR